LSPASGIERNIIPSEGVFQIHTLPNGVSNFLTMPIPLVIQAVRVSLAAFVNLSLEIP